VRSWTDRYLAGDRGQVWAEMLGAGPRLRADPVGWEQARTVAELTMRRARGNVERLIDMLPAGGYRFEPGEGLPVFEPPAADITDQLDRLEATTGPLPLALRAWLAQVGRVNLTGSHPAWRYAYSDPLVVDAPVDYIHSEYRDWEADRGTEWDRGVFTVDIAPDYLHKANVSGGAPYGLAVPDPAADGILLWERHQTTFVGYLRLAFGWGGFPGWDRGQLDGWARPDEPTPAVLSRWAADLLPL
jgi:hypothetical protein